MADVRESAPHVRVTENKRGAEVLYTGSESLEFNDTFAE